MLPIYIWQYPEWPRLVWDDSRVITLLSEVRSLQGRILGQMSVLGFDVQSATSLNAMCDDVLRSSEIEGIQLNEENVRSSIAKYLGLDYVGLVPDHYSEGVVQVMLDAVQNNSLPLTHERLFAWHSALFPSGRSGLYKINVGEYRTSSEPMQVVSGAMGKERVHYEAPPSADVRQMMDDFLVWINADLAIDPIIKAAVAHIWFVAIHPFDDGNGRIARTITDLLLARADGVALRYYSMSAEVLRKRKTYYQVLETDTVSGTDITLWIEWFLTTLSCSLRRAQSDIERVVAKTLFWHKNRNVPMNDRQVKIVNRLWEGIEGKMTTSKWAKMTKTSQATALRDITDLIEKGILTSAADGGRSTNYVLVAE